MPFTACLDNSVSILAMLRRTQVHLNKKISAFECKKERERYNSESVKKTKEQYNSIQNDQPTNYANGS